MKSELKAFQEKVEHVRMLLGQRRCYYAPPAHLRWLYDWFRGQRVQYPPAYSSPTPNDSTPIDRVARTFCRLEEMEAWIKRLDAGMARHQAEMERQSMTKIARLKMASEFSGKSDDEDCPF